MGTASPFEPRRFQHPFMMKLNDTTAAIHIGVDLGGTKIRVEAISDQGASLARRQQPTPRHDYSATIEMIASLVEAVEAALSLPPCLVGIGMPGSIVPATGLVQNANSTWLNGKPFSRDLTARLGRAIRTANDANCFALSEAVDGAAAGAQSVFGVIMGTGVGGGLVINGQLVEGPRSISGEWGHCSLPFPDEQDIANQAHCWCGQRGCIETWLSGPGLLHHHNAAHDLAGKSALERVEELVILAQEGDRAARSSLDKHARRTAKALALVVNIVDPEVIVLGGGLSQLSHLYQDLPHLMAPFLFTDDPTPVDIRPPKFGATSGVRGAARLWPFQRPFQTA